MIKTEHKQLKKNCKKNQSTEITVSILGKLNVIAQTFFVFFS